MRRVSPYTDEELLRLALDELDELRRLELMFGPATSRRVISSNKLRQRALVKEIALLRRRIGLASRPMQRRTPDREAAAARARATKNHKRRAAAEGRLRCEACGWQPPPPLAAIRILHCHHVIPVNCGGSNDDSNLIILCPNCHAIAHAKTPRTKPWRGAQSREALVLSLTADPLNEKSQGEVSV